MKPEERVIKIFGQEFRHLDKVTCTIKRTEIPDAVLWFGDPGGFSNKIHILQNMKSGNHPDGKEHLAVGYRHSWAVRDPCEPTDGVSVMKLITSKSVIETFPIF